MVPKLTWTWRRREKYLSLLGIKLVNILTEPPLIICFFALPLTHMFSWLGAYLSKVTSSWCGTSQGQLGIYVKEVVCEGVNWVYLTQYRAHWWAHVNTIMNLHFIEDGEYLDFKLAS